MDFLRSLNEADRLFEVFTEIRFERRVALTGLDFLYQGI